MSNKDFEDGRIACLMMMDISKPEWVLDTLFGCKHNTPGMCMFARDENYWYIKIVEWDEEWGENEFKIRSEDFYKGALEAYSLITDIPHENAIVKYELEDGMLKDHEWSFISDTDSSLQNLTLDWHSRAELGIENVPQLQNGVF